MKTTFKTFISESALTKAITLEQAVELAFLHFKQAFNAKPMYRGYKRNPSDAQLVHPSKGNGPRKSTTGVNITNTLMSNLPEWKDYPLRNQSVIGSFDIGVAKRYSDHVYRVFPVDGAKIGICPSIDLWGSFHDVQDKFGIDVGDNQQFDQLVRDAADIILYLVGDKTDLSNDEISKFTHQQLMHLFDKVDGALKKLKSSKKDDEIVQDIVDRYDGRYHNQFEHWVKFYVHQIGSYLTAISFILDPKENGFKLLPVSQVKKGAMEDDSEFWTSQPCLLINVEVIDEFDRLLSAKL